MSTRRATPVMAGPVPEWPHRTLDLAVLRSSGWRPTPFRDVVLKVHQRCNLQCHYCYVYTMADQSWRDRPVRMSRSTWRTTAQRMAEHAATHQLPSMRLVLHGGEPLLLGTTRIAELIQDFRGVFDGTCRLDIQVQSNGVLIDAALLDLFLEQRVGVGVSLDGNAADNDRRRPRPDGRGSHDAVDRAIRLLAGPRYRPIFAGLLCTVDPTADPLSVYDALLAYTPPWIDLLLPHATWQSPPNRPPVGGPTPHGDWLIRMFDRWYDAPRQETAIRLFEDVMALILGGTGRSEQVGLSPVAVVVVETDGAIEQVDSLKSAYPGACHTGRTVYTDPLDAAFDHPGIVARQIGAEALSPTCRACSVSTVCGAGHYVHRYRAVDGFHNPTVYCADMFKLILHVRDRMAADLARSAANAPD